MPAKNSHLFVILQGGPGQEDIEIPWEEWAAWQRARIFAEYRDEQAAKRRPATTATTNAIVTTATTTTTGQDRAAAEPDPADDLYGSEPPEAA
jgi:hypothetical protein